MAPLVGDFNGDGWLDVLVANYIDTDGDGSPDTVTSISVLVNGGRW